MTMTSHLQELRRKHQTLSEKVEQAQRSPGMDALAIAETEEAEAQAEGRDLPAQRKLTPTALVCRRPPPGGGGSDLAGADYDWYRFGRARPAQKNGHDGLTGRCARFCSRWCRRGSDAPLVVENLPWKAFGHSSPRGDVSTGKKAKARAPLPLRRPLPADGGAGSLARQGRGGAQTKNWPPLAEIVEPLMNPASSEARKTTQRAISSGSPSRPDRDLRDDRFAHLLRHRHHHVGGDIARADRVDGDADARALLGQRLGDAEIAGLGGGIVHLGELALLAVDRARS